MIAIASLTMVGFAAQAQPISIAPEAGVNITNFAGDSEGNSTKTGFKVGLNFNLPISSNLYLQPGLFYSTKGAKNENTLTILGVTTTTSTLTNIGYLEVPINLMYRYPVGDGAVFFSAGPYLAYAVNGKNNIEITIGSSTTETTNDISFGSDNNQTNPFDYGVNVGLGYELPMGLYIRAQYGIGMGNLSNVDNEKYTNTNLQFSLGYNLWSYNR